MLSFGKVNNQFVAVFDAIDGAKLSENLAWLRRKGCVFMTQSNGYHKTCRVVFSRIPASVCLKLSERFMSISIR